MTNIKTDQDNIIIHISLVKDDMMIMLCPENSMGMTLGSPATTGVEDAITLFCYCENVDELYNRAIRYGAKSIMGPETQFWGERRCHIRDIDNYRWIFVTNLIQY